MSAHWTGDPHPPEIDSSVTAWAERLAAMSAQRRDVTGVRYTAARLPWIRLVLDSVAAHGTLSALVRAAMGRPASVRRRGQQPVVDVPASTETDETRPGQGATTEGYRVISEGGATLPRAMDRRSNAVGTSTTGC